MKLKTPLSANMKFEETVLRLLVCCVGFSPIASLSLSAFGLIPLNYSGPLIVLPAILLIVFLSRKYSYMRKFILEGLIIGIISVLIYDSFRLTFVFLGYMDDFIPKVGNYLLNTTNVHWTVGYTWRYIGNGGGMGMAFCMLVPIFPAKWKSNLRITGVIYGLTIFTCLLATIYLSSAGRTYLFNPDLFKGGIVLAGHIIYGWMLGLMYPLVSFSSGRNYVRYFKNSLSSI